MPRIRMAVTCGDIVFDKGILPISDYPLIPYYNSHDGVSTGVSEVMFLVDPQKAENAITNLIIQNIATSTNAPWVYEEGSIDEAKLKENGSVQGGAVSFRPGAPAPVRSAPAPIPQALFAYPQELKSHMEYVSGSFSMSQGASEDAPSTYRATLQIEEWAARKLGKKRRMISSSLKRAGNVVLSLMQKVYTQPDMIRIVGMEGIDKKTQINLNTPLGILNDVTAGAYDVQIVDDSTMATSVMAREGINLERFKLGLIDRMQYILEGNFKNKEELLSRMAEINQAQGTIQGQQQEMKKKDIQIGQMENELRRGERRIQIKEFQADLDVELARQKLAIKEQMAALKIKERELQAAEKDMRREQAADKKAASRTQQEPGLRR